MHMYVPATMVKAKDNDMYSVVCGEPMLNAAANYKWKKMKASRKAASS